jgi:hypothetical protein
MRDDIKQALRIARQFGGQAYASQMAALGAKGGGRINTTIDRDPDWDMGLADGGEVDNAMRVARLRLHREDGGDIPAPVLEDRDFGPGMREAPITEGPDNTKIVGSGIVAGDPEAKWLETSRAAAHDAMIDTALRDMQGRTPGIEEQTPTTPHSRADNRTTSPQNRYGSGATPYPEELTRVPEWQQPHMDNRPPRPGEYPSHGSTAANAFTWHPPRPVSNETVDDILGQMRQRADGGEVDAALRVARQRLEFGGIPEDDRYKALQDIGGTQATAREQAIGRFLPRMTYHESRDNPSIGSKTSSAAGLAQFTRPTWKTMTQGEPEIAGKSRDEINAMRRDATPEGQQFQLRMAEKLANVNADELEKRGLEVTPANLYGVHFGGPAGARALAAPDRKPLRQIFGDAALNANPFLKKMSAGDFRNFTQKSMGETAAMMGADSDFKRAQVPGDRFQNLQTAMAQPSDGAPSAMPPSAASATQMAMNVPATPKSNISADLLAPPVRAQAPTAAPTPAPTQVAAATPPSSPQSVGANVVAQDAGNDAHEFVQSQGVGVPEQPMPDVQAPEQPMEMASVEPPDMTAGLENMFSGFADGGYVNDALRLASGGGAWTRKEGKNPKGGLNAKGRASLKAQGHDIKPPQPEGGPRRDSFCSRMKGMKKKLTSKETANDPNSRINKSLRAWNCANGGEVWDKPRPKKLGKSKGLTDAQQASAKASAKSAGRPYPNLIDNMKAARKD